MLSTFYFRSVLRVISKLSVWAFRVVDLYSTRVHVCIGGDLYTRDGQTGERERERGSNYYTATFQGVPATQPSMSMASSTRPPPFLQVLVSASWSTRCRRARSRRVCVVLSHCQPCPPVSINPIARTISPIIVKFPLHHVRPQYFRHLLGVFDESLGLFACGSQVPADFKPTAGFGERCVEDVRIASRRLATTGVWAAAEGTLKSGPGGAEEAAIGCECHYVDRGRFFLE